MTTATSKADVASLVGAWRQSIRDCGFLAPFVNEDWGVRNANEEELRVHREFQASYWTAVVEADDKHQIVYSDDLMPGRVKLNELKRRRFEQHGPIGKIFANPATRHHAELSPVLEMISRTDERMTPADILASNGRFAEREAEKRRTLEVFARELSPVLNSGNAVRGFPVSVIGTRLSGTSNSIGSVLDEGSTLTIELVRGAPACARLVLEFDFELSVLAEFSLPSILAGTMPGS